MQSICSMNLKSFFFFCDYKEANVFRRMLTFMYRNVATLFVKSKPSYASGMVALAFKYLILTFLIIGATLAYKYYGDYIKCKWLQLESWIKVKYEECKHRIERINMPKYSYEIKNIALTSAPNDQQARTSGWKQSKKSSRESSIDSNDRTTTVNIELQLELDHNNIG